jgi:hypothetical protein
MPQLMDKIGIKSLILKRSASLQNHPTRPVNIELCKLYPWFTFFTSILIDPTLFDQYFHIGKIVLNKMAELKVFLSRS